MKNDIVSRNFNFIGRNDQKYDNNLLERQVNNIMLHFESDIKHGVKNPFILLCFYAKKRRLSIIQRNLVVIMLWHTQNDKIFLKTFTK